MSSGHCGRCGAKSTIWLPTCVFCGCSLADGAPAGDARPKPTARGERRDEAPGFFRAFWARLTAIRR
jgi:hypothetical protein